MKPLDKFHLLLFVLVTNCSIAQNRGIQAIDLEELSIGNIDIVQGIDSANNIGYYKYIDKKSVINEFGEPDEMQTRNDDLLETEIVRVKYGASCIEFFDHSFGEGLDQNKYSLFSIEFSDAKVWLKYRDQIIKVGEELPAFYEQINDNNEAVITLRRGILDQLSDYVLKVRFKGKKVSSLTAAFD